MTRLRSRDSGRSERAPTLFSTTTEGGGASVRDTPLTPRTEPIPEDDIAAGGEEDDGSESSSPGGDAEDVAPCSEALTKSYSLLFGLGQLTDELCRLHDIVTIERPVLVRPFILRTLADKVNSLWAPKDQMSLQQALATLYGREYKPLKRPWIQKIARGEKWFRSQRSICEFLPFPTRFPLFELPVTHESVC